MSNKTIPKRLAAGVVDYWTRVDGDGAERYEEGRGLRYGVTFRGKTYRVTSESDALRLKKHLMGGGDRASFEIGVKTLDDQQQDSAWVSQRVQRTVPYHPEGAAALPQRIIQRGFVVRQIRPGTLSVLWDGASGPTYCETSFLGLVKDVDVEAERRSFGWEVGAVVRRGVLDDDQNTGIVMEGQADETQGSPRVRVLWRKGGQSCTKTTWHDSKSLRDAASFAGMWVAVDNGRRFPSAEEGRQRELTHYRSRKQPILLASAEIPAFGEEIPALGEGERMVAVAFGEWEFTTANRRTYAVYVQGSQVIPSRGHLLPGLTVLACTGEIVGRSDSWERALTLTRVHSILRHRKQIQQADRIGYPIEDAERVDPYTANGPEAMRKEAARVFGRDSKKWPRLIREWAALRYGAQKQS